MSGPYYAIGQLVRAARKRRGMTRRLLVRLIRIRRALDVSAWHAALIVRELEDDGKVVNDDVLSRTLEVVGISRVEVEDLLSQARAASAAAFTKDLKRAAKVIAKEHGRPTSDVQAGLVQLSEIMQRRPMA